MSQADQMIKHETHTIGGKSQKVQVLKCTQKGCKARTKTTRPTSHDKVIAMAKDKGWNINLAHKSAICPAHSEDNKPREMTRDHKRRIWREIDDNYVTKSYVVGVTDKSIGLKLDVPWAWVKQVREEDFGPAGTDPEIAKMEASINTMQDRVLELEKIGFRCAEMADRIGNDINLLKGQMTTLLKSRG